MWRLHAVTEASTGRMLQSLCYLRSCLQIGLPTLGWNSVVLMPDSEKQLRDGVVCARSLGRLGACAVLLPGVLKCGFLQVPLPHLPLAEIFLR